MDGIAGHLAEVGVAGILVILILDRVVKLGSYIKNGNSKVGNPGNVVVGQSLNEVMREMFESLRAMKTSIENGNKQSCEAMGKVCDSLEKLSGEVQQMKGKVG